MKDLLYPLLQIDAKRRSANPNAENGSKSLAFRYHSDLRKTFARQRGLFATNVAPDKHASHRPRKRKMEGKDAGIEE